MYYIGNAVSDIGTVKKVNQDSLTLKIANTKWGSVCLAVMCDGVGGLQQGELASATIVRGFDQWFKKVFPYENGRWSEQKLKLEWDHLIQSLNLELCEYGEETGVKLGSTVTAALFWENRYLVAHVGDCRMYQIRNELRQITKDQTLVQKEIDQGLMKESEREADQRKSILLQSVGTVDMLQISYYSGELLPDTVYLLCTDGFRHEIREDELVRLFAPEQNSNMGFVEKNLKYVVEQVKARGEHDNISAIAVRVG